MLQQSQGLKDNVATKSGAEGQCCNKVRGRRTMLQQSQGLTDNVATKSEAEGQCCNKVRG